MSSSIYQTLFFIIISKRIFSSFVRRVYISRVLVTFVVVYHSNRGVAAAVLHTAVDLLGGRSRVAEAVHSDDDDRRRRSDRVVAREAVAAGSASSDDMAAASAMGSVETRAVVASGDRPEAA